MFIVSRCSAVECVFIVGDWFATSTKVKCSMRISKDYARNAVDALEYAISFGHYDQDCRRYQSILDSGWVRGFATGVVLTGVHPKIPLGMQRSFFIEICFHGNGGSPARWEIRFGNGAARSYELVFGKFTGHGSGHFVRWHPLEWYLF